MFMTWVDNKNAFNCISHSWIVKCLRMLELSEIVGNLWILQPSFGEHFDLKLFRKTGINWVFKVF